MGRTRDKIAATRRKGKWAGGHPILGYDVDPQRFNLVVNPADAEQVRAILDLYLEHGSLLQVQELDQRGWTHKRWQTRKGVERGGTPFTRTSLYQLLLNVAYVGRVRYKAEVRRVEQAAIVEEHFFQQTQQLLQRNGRASGGPVRNQFGALLKGILMCALCVTRPRAIPQKTAAAATTTTSVPAPGRARCPSKSEPDGVIESFVLDRIRTIGQDPELVKRVVKQARSRDQARREELHHEQQPLQRELKACPCLELQLFGGKLVQVRTYNSPKDMLKPCFVAQQCSKLRSRGPGTGRATA